MPRKQTSEPTSHEPTSDEFKPESVEPAGQRIGYIRVSTLIQNTERQLAGLNLDKVFEDKKSGKDTERPKLQEMIAYVRKGDTVLVHSIDRLARNLQDLQNVVRQMNDKGVTVQFVKDNLTFSGDDGPTSKLLLHILGAFAEFDRALILEKTQEGREIAKAKGAYKGRKPKFSSTQRKNIAMSVLNGADKNVLAAQYKCSYETIRRTAKEYLDKHGYSMDEEEQDVAS